MTKPTAQCAADYLLALEARVAALEARAPAPEPAPGDWGDLPEGYLSPHFRRSEFECNHCGSLEGHEVAPELLQVLEKLRYDLGQNPVTINSGYRCQVHNNNVGSTESSQHRKATAADIIVSGVSPDTVHKYLIDTYPDKYGIGRYSSFVHIDVRPNKARW